MAEETKQEEKAPVAELPPDNGKEKEPETTRVPEPEKEPEKAESGQAEEVDLDDVEKDEDGQLIYRAGESVYKGKNLKELLSNIGHGITEKDRFIAKSKIREKVQVPDHIRKSKVADEAHDEPIELPDKDEIFSRHAEAVAKRAGVDMKMVGMTDEQYQAYAEERNLSPWQLSRLVGKIDAAMAEADRLATQEYNDRTQVFVNNRILDDEKESIVDLLVDANVSAEEFDFEALLSRVYTDPKNKKPNGVLKSGVVTAEAAKEIRKIVAGRTKSEVRKKIEEDIAKGKEAKERIKTGSVLPQQGKDKKPTFTSYEDAARSAIADAQAKSRK